MASCSYTSSDSASAVSVSTSEPETSEDVDISSNSISNDVCMEKQKFSRPNTTQEKRKMRNNRKKRKRGKAIKDLRLELEAERKKNESCQNRIALYRGMSRSYWERWRWELEKRKEAVMQIKSMYCLQKKPQGSNASSLQEIEPSMLIDISTRLSDASYVGRGSFSLVKVQTYRGILVAVKEFLPRTMVEDVINEAKILMSFCHPYVPCLLGVCRSERPFRLVMQFEGVIEDDVPTVLTLFLLLKKSCGVISTVQEWILAFVQLAEALSYLHNIAGILHNDIKPDNILLSNTSASNSGYQIILSDYGKATTLSNSKRYHLSGLEQAEYTKKYTHLAPELINGESKQSLYSDIFAFGGVLYKVMDAKKLDSCMCVRSQVGTLAERCRSVHYRTRPKTKEIITYLQAITY